MVLFEFTARSKFALWTKLSQYPSDVRRKLGQKDTKIDANGNSLPDNFELSFWEADCFVLFSFMKK